MYIRRVTAAHAHEDLHRLVDRLTLDQAREVRKHVLRLVRPDEPGAVEMPADRIPAFAGVIEDGPPDLAERIEEFTEERFNYPL